MLSNVSEKKLHAIRWVIFLAWALLIVSLFYDPISAILTHPENTWSPLADPTIAIAQNLEECVKVQEKCIPLSPYPISMRVFWGMVIPSAIFVVLVFGHEFWRRICPLYFFSQLPRALGMKPLLNIERNQWLQKNHFYVQFILFFLGITGRILFFNAVRPVTAILFIVTLLSAAIIVALYGGRSWCHYVCPFGMVQTVFTGPKGLLDSQAHMAEPLTLTQSTCRTIDAQGQEQNACISCKSACMDIDSEQSYWEQLYKPGRRLVQYGYLGLVMGYFFYYSLYAGNFRYYFSGIWSHEKQSLTTLVSPGFYILNQAIAIPKFVAAPLTLAAFAAFSCWLCTRIERYYRGYLKQRHLTPKGLTQNSLQQKSVEATAEESLHKMFSLCTFLAFNIFFIYGGRPEINNFPIAVQFGFQALIGLVSGLWLHRTWGRSRAKYQQESLVNSRRRRLKKSSINVDELLANSGDGRTIEQLSATELRILNHTLDYVTETTDTTGTSTPEVNTTGENATDCKPLPLSKTILRNSTSKATQSKTQFPKAQFPKAQFPKTQHPKTQFPKAQFPKTQHSKIQFPKAHSPKTQLPKTLSPKPQPPKTQLRKP